MAPELVLLGHISRANGLRGDVLIKSHTSDPANISKYGPLTDKEGVRAFDVKVVRITNKGVIARINGVADRNAAEALRGIELYVARDKLPPPEDDEFYYTDLIGMDAVDCSGTKVGTIVAIQNYGAGDIIEIRPVSGKQTVLLPFDKTYVPKIDPETRQIVVNWPPET